MKELTLEEVLKIAGGVPPPAALDELTYRAPQEEGRDLPHRERLLGDDSRPSDPPLRTGFRRAPRRAPLTQELSMKEVEKKELPEVSGGQVPIDGPCIPIEWPWPVDYPQNPSGPAPEAPLK